MNYSTSTKHHSWYKTKQAANVRKIRTSVTFSVNVSTVTEMSNLPQVIIVTGPTAVGKTNVGLELARLLDGEIISADSVQVYKGLDVGSDKLPESQRRGIPHHIIDVRQPGEEFSAGHFYEEARAVTADIIKRGRVPIVVGGTGLYLRWYMLGKAETAKPSPELAETAQKIVDEAISKAAADAEVPVAELTAEARWSAAVSVLERQGDMEATTRIRAERNNYYRLTRALQVLLAAPGKTLAEMDIDEQRPLDYDFRCFFLHRSRVVLHERITERIESMVMDGLLDEAASLLAAGFGPNTSMATRAIGYRQAMEWLTEMARRGTSVTPADISTLIMNIKVASNRLVRNQLTWFRDEEVYRWVNMDEMTPQHAAEFIALEVAKPVHQGGSSDSNGYLTKEELNTLKRNQLRLLHVTKPENMVPLLKHIQDDLLPSFYSLIKCDEPPENDNTSAEDSKDGT